MPVTPFRQNCSVLWCAASMAGAIVDPGGDLDEVLAAAAAHRVRVEKILVTHGHVDHAAGVAGLAARLGVPVEGPHADDAFWIDQLGDHGRRYGFAEAAPFVPDRWLVDGDTVTVGRQVLSVRHCPGHTPGHVVFHHADTQFAVVGDVLFRGSIGRTDFPRGNHAHLIGSIRSRLWPMGDDTTFLPGHGPVSTFGDERRTNPFCSDLALEFFDADDD